MSKKKHKQWGKTYVNHNQPLYKSEDFIIYFEHRMRKMVREEIDVLFSNIFYNAPY